MGVVKPTDDQYAMQGLGKSSGYVYTERVGPLEKESPIGACRCVCSHHSVLSPELLDLQEATFEPQKRILHGSQTVLLVLE